MDEIVERAKKKLKNKRKIIITMKIAMKNDNEKHLIGNRDGKVAKARESL